MSGGYPQLHPISGHHVNASGAALFASGGASSLLAAAAAYAPFGAPPNHSSPAGAQSLHNFSAASFVANGGGSASSSAQQRLKLKRARQRVDAGEPRNCYSSIQSSNAAGRVNGSGSSMSAGDMATAAATTAATAATRLPTPNFGAGTFASVSRLAHGASGEPADYLPHMQSAWLRLQQQALKESCGTAAETEQKPEDDPSSDTTVVHTSPTDRDNNNDEKTTAVVDGDPKEEVLEDTGKEEQEMAEVEPNTEPLDKQDEQRNKLSEEDEEANELAEMNADSFGSPKSTGTSEASPKSKRKCYQPQQVDQDVDENEVEEEDEPNDEPARKSPNTAKVDKEEAQATPADAGAASSKVQELLVMQRQWYVDWLSQQHKKLLSNDKPLGDSGANALADATMAGGAPHKDPTESLGVKPEERQKEIKTLGQTIKTELIANMSSTVDKIIQEYMRAEAARLGAQQQMRAAAIAAQQHQRQQQQQQQAHQERQQHPAFAAAAAAAAAASSRPFYMNQLYPSFPYPAAAGAGLNFSPTAGVGSIFPSAYGNGVAGMSGAAAAWTNAALAAAAKREAEGGGGGGYSVMPRKKRSKVTDTRLSKMPVRGGSAAGNTSADGLLTGRSSPISGYYPPTMVGHPLYGAAGPFGGGGMGDERDVEMSPGNSDDTSDMGQFEGGPQESTLTPMHLRKAKLVFFYSRYPSSTLLKTYFPDIRFNKNTTAQLVKWFSNFREFYYIQMEKYARQALAEGVKRAEDNVVSVDSEIYKVLNQHYNRNNHIQVPASYRAVVEATLREFFLAIQAGRDTESSWKKQIYKVIARLDDTIPDYFKNPNFLEQLE